MVIALLVVSIIGAAATVAGLWPYSPLLAVLGAPFGGSLLAVLVAGLVALRRSEPDEGFDPEWERATNEMVALLRQTAEQGRQHETARTAPSRSAREAA